jgi:uncharacterized repeat protein (TIGR01451 family)
MIVSSVPSPAAAQLSPAQAQAQESALARRRAAMMQQSVLARQATQATARTADMSIAARGGSKGIPAAGDQVTYTLVITNGGPSDANRAQVTLALDTSNISVAQVRGACNALPCYLPTMASGSSQRIMVDLHVQSGGAFGFTARVRALQPDPDPTYNAAVVRVTPRTSAPVPTPVEQPPSVKQPPPVKQPPTADISIIAGSDAKSMPAVGDLVTYYLSVGNAGPSEANRTQVSLALDTTNISVEQVRGACSALPCYLPTMPSGSAQRVTVDLRIESEGGFGFTARARALQPDPDQTNNTAVVSVTPPPVAPPGQEAPTADVSITASGGSRGTPKVGDLVTYTLVVANAGPAEVDPAQVTLVPDAANISIEHVRGACDALPCDLPTLAPGSSRTILVDLRIQSGGAFSFTARVRAAQPDPDPANNTAVVSVTLPAIETPGTPQPAPSSSPPECFDCEPPPPWWQDWINRWTLGSALVLGLALIGVAIRHWLRHQARQRWLRRLQVTADVESMVCEAGPIPLAAPGLTLSVRCEPGEAGAPGAVPINKVVYDD